MSQENFTVSEKGIVLASPLTLPFSESLASSMPVARSIFVPTTPSHPAPISRTQSLTPNRFALLCVQPLHFDARGGF